MIRSLLFRLLCLLCMLLPGMLPSVASGASLCCQFSSGVQENLAGMAAPSTGETLLQFTYSFTRMDRLQEGTTARTLYDVSASTAYTSLPVHMDMIKYTVSAGYGISPRFKVFASLPYLRNTMDMTMSRGVGLGWMEMTMAPVSSPGDATIMGLYRLFVDQPLQPAAALSVGLGIKTPTGSSTVTTAGGEYLHAHMQPGTGSWDPLLSLLFTRMLNTIDLQADVTRQFTTRNRQGYEFGDSTSMTVSARYTAWRLIDPTLGVTFLHAAGASDREGRYSDPASLMDDPANTGGDSLWIAPGIELFPHRQMAVTAKIQVPVWEKVNGIQLVSSYRLVSGISYRF